MNRQARRIASARDRRPSANITLTMAPMTAGALALDIQECRDIEAWATEFVEATGTPLPVSDVKYAVFESRGLNMALFRIASQETMQ